LCDNLLLALVRLGLVVSYWAMVEVAMMAWGKAWWLGFVLGFWFIGKSRRKTNMVFPFFLFPLSLLYCSLYLCKFLTFYFLFLFSTIHPLLYRLIFFPPMYPPFYSLFSHISSPCKNFHTFLILSPFFFPIFMFVSYPFFNYHYAH